MEAYPSEDVFNPNCGPRAEEMPAIYEAFRSIEDYDGMAVGTLSIPSFTRSCAIFPLFRRNEFPEFKFKQRVDVLVKQWKRLTLDAYKYEQAS